MYGSKVFEILTYWPVSTIKCPSVLRFILREFVIAQIPITAYQEPRLHDKHKVVAITLLSVNEWKILSIIHLTRKQIYLCPMHTINNDEKR